MRKLTFKRLVTAGASIHPLLRLTPELILPREPLLALPVHSSTVLCAGFLGSTYLCLEFYFCLFVY